MIKISILDVSIFEVNDPKTLMFDQNISLPELISRAGIENTAKKKYFDSKTVQ